VVVADPAPSRFEAGFPFSRSPVATALADESDRRDRVAFGRLTDPDPDRYAWDWLAVTAHVAAIEQELIRSSWAAPSAG
jgi:hypothetical protein